MFCFVCFVFYSVQLYCYFIEFPTSPSLVLLHPSSAIPLSLPLTHTLRINYFLCTRILASFGLPHRFRALSNSFTSAPPSFSSLRNPLFERQQICPVSQDHSFFPSPRANPHSSLEARPSLDTEDVLPHHPESLSFLPSVP